MCLVLKMSTDGVAVCLLYSKTVLPSTTDTENKKRRVEMVDRVNRYTLMGGKRVGLDPGKRNIVTSPWFARRKRKSGTPQNSEILKVAFADTKKREPGVV